MQVNGLDHVNIVAKDLDETVRFYERVLGMSAQWPPSVMPGFQGRWLCDSGGRPIIHLMGYDDERHAARRFGPQAGSIDHVAIACSDFAGTIRHCEELGIEHRVNDRKYGNLRQVFITDPNEVTLELNFSGD